MAVQPSNPATVPKLVDALPIPDVLQPSDPMLGELFYQVRMR